MKPALLTRGMIASALSWIIASSCSDNVSLHRSCLACDDLCLGASLHSAAIVAPESAVALLVGRAAAHSSCSASAWVAQWRPRPQAMPGEVCDRGKT
eukprot:1158407-Pelagomonas_calceolata.AAC.8